MIESHTGSGNVARVNQSYLTANIWLRAECGNTIPDRSKGQPNQLRYSREWRRVAWGIVAYGGVLLTSEVHQRATRMA